jgi:hypothetical protein
MVRNVETVQGLHKNQGSVRIASASAENNLAGRLTAREAATSKVRELVCSTLSVQDIVAFGSSSGDSVVEALSITGGVSRRESVTSASTIAYLQIAVHGIEQ